MKKILVFTIFILLLFGCTKKPSYKESNYNTAPQLILRHSSQKVLVKKVLQATYFPDEDIYRIIYFSKDEEGNPIPKSADFPASVTILKTERGDCEIVKDELICP